MLSSVALLVVAGGSKTVEIAPGVFMPKVNLGTCCGSDPKVGVAPWLADGGVGIDTAFNYQDQPAIAAALATAGAKREDVFILSKVPATSNCAGGAAQSFQHVQDDLKQLNTDYVDVVLLHHPCPSDADNQALWQGLVQALEKNMTRAIGVSNYNQAQIEGLLKVSSVKPAVNQCEMSVKTHDDATIAYCQKMGITYEAFDTMRGCDFSSPLINSIAKKHNATAAQVCLRYVIDRDCVLAVGTGANSSTVVPYTKENLGVYDFQLTQDEIKQLSSA
eukprot:TRINITY_DN8800_c0_g1_i1.p1 TRINITY_DN8800_c0_g1~~TRINITY_DN8800_c0_g1_i1.p1  ORF type:complete len:276 (+),score=94.95 TRINITY_DN8800_c0_g1_i1:60-887(+)